MFGPIKLRRMRSDSWPDRKPLPPRPLALLWLAWTIALSPACVPKGSIESPATASPATQLLGEHEPVAYVADSQCTTCHADLAESFQHVGMSHSFTSNIDWTEDRWTEDFANSHYYHPASDQHFEMQQRDGQVFQIRYQLDQQGQRVHELSVAVDGVIGSGNHVHCFVSRTECGEMFQLPLAWYTQERIWRMNPGYDHADHPGFQRKITRECMFCHNAFPDLSQVADDFWQPHIFPQPLPQGIGCQRCHGPGGTHVQLAQSDQARDKDIRDSIVNPIHLQPHLRDDVCDQCHLQPSSQILSEMVRFGRGEYSFRPGQDLNAFRALLDYHSPSSAVGGDREDRFEINHHPYRLRQSRCYIESFGALNCLTCHNPHREVPAEDRALHYQQACLSCHSMDACRIASEQLSSSEHISVSAPIDCVGCHMPERRTHDAVHVTMTDHKIVAKPAPASERLVARSEPPPERGDIEVFPYVEPLMDDDFKGEMWVYEAIAGLQTGGKHYLSKLIEYVNSTQTTRVQPLAELATALRDYGETEQELHALFRIVQEHPDHVQANLELAMALAAAGDHAQSLEFYQRAAAIGPPLPEVAVGIGVSLLHGGDLIAAENQFREALRLRPHYPEGLLNLGIVLHMRQQWTEAQKMLNQALAADPSFVEAKTYLQSIPTSSDN